MPVPFTFIPIYISHLVPPKQLTLVETRTLPLECFFPLAAILLLYVTFQQLNWGNDSERKKNVLSIDN